MTKPLTPGTVALAAQEALDKVAHTGVAMPSYVVAVLFAAAELRDAPTTWAP